MCKAAAADREANVERAISSKGTSLEPGSRLFALENARQVQNDCQSIDPG
jgi:hypothetical protein